MCDEIYEIVSLTPNGEIQVKSLKSGEIVTFPLSKIQAPKENKTIHGEPFDTLTEKQKATAKKRYSMIKPLIQSPHGKKYLTAQKCEFISELFYEGRLDSQPSLEKQKLTGDSVFAKSALLFVPVEHEGNQNSSIEEAEKVAEMVSNLLQQNTIWVNAEGQSKTLQLEDILIVTPYNAQVSAICEQLNKSKMGEARVGTVDKFQGQEAPVAIYTMATSSPEEAPRGMEFLYSLHRFNVAISRARCCSILVANQRLLEPECNNPRQMQLANAFCRYNELSYRPG